MRKPARRRSMCDPRAVVVSMLPAEEAPGHTRERATRCQVAAARRFPAWRSKHSCWSGRLYRATRPRIVGHCCRGKALAQFRPAPVTGLQGAAWAH